MARINTNVAALLARSDLRKAEGSLNTAMQRLSSGLRINRGADDPAGLIASETLRSEMAGISEAIDNSERASSVIATAEGALNEVASLLVDIKSLTVEAANEGGISPEEIRANQLQIDSAVQSITRIANVTNFAGLNLLDGSLDYQLSGVTNSQITTAHVYNCQFGDASSVAVDVDIVQSAQQAELFWPTSSVSGALVLEIAGNDGVETVNLASGATAGTILAAINQVTDATGVAAEFITAGTSTDGLKFTSGGWGSSQFVSVQALPGSGTFDTFDAAAAGNASARQYGRDVAATINGAYTVGDGLNLSLNSTYLTLDLVLNSGLGSTDTSFTITGGGALFQLGPHVSINEQKSFGIQSIAASRLGDSTIGFMSQVVTGGDYSLVAGEASQAAKIVDEAINIVASLRGRMGAFEKNTLNTNISSLEVALENVTASESTIRDANFAEETSNLTRGQILQSASTSVLAIANSTPQSVLSLLQ